MHYYGGMRNAPLLTLALPAGSCHPAGAADRLVAAFLAGRSPQTVRAYHTDLADFAACTGVSGIAEAAAQLLASGHGTANETVLHFRSQLQARGLAPATINRRLAALRSLVKLARTLGLVPWILEVEGVRTESYRDTRGPGHAGFRQLLAVLDGRLEPKAIRDRALLRLLYDLGLRRAEVVGLDVEDFDAAAGTVAVLGKGRTQKVNLTLPPETMEALAAWLAVRGVPSGSMFTALDRVSGGKRLSGMGLYLVVRQIGERAGISVRPHGLRHAAITRALDLTGGDIRSVQRFSRHKDVRLLQRYDDNRQDLGGVVARRLAEDVQKAG
jgi:integrase/recombinase XerC